MITQDYLTISPAYDRDYRNGKLAGQDFLDGKDFKMESLGQGGTYCSIRDFAPGVKIQIRYNKLQNVRVLVAPALERK